MRHSRANRASRAPARCGRETHCSWRLAPLHSRAPAALRRRLAGAAWHWAVGVCAPVRTNALGSSGRVRPPSSTPTSCCGQPRAGAASARVRGACGSRQGRVQADAAPPRPRPRPRLAPPPAAQARERSRATYRYRRGHGLVPGREDACRSLLAPRSRPLEARRSRVLCRLCPERTRTAAYRETRPAMPPATSRGGAPLLF